jgi:hypothetical protein
MPEKKLNIHQAMLKFHGLFQGALKSGTNLHFKSKYFTLDDLVNAITPSLQECGLYVVHQVNEGCLVTSVRDAEGESIESSILLPINPNPQITGSNLTYFKKYNITGLFNIPEASDLDDDGNLGADAAEIERQKEKTIVPKPPATEEQKSTLQDYIDKYALDARFVAYIDANIEKMSGSDVEHEIFRLKKAETDKTLTEKENGK